MSILEVVQNKPVKTYSGVESCGLGWDYIRSMGGTCGGGDYGNTNRRLACGGDEAKSGSCYIAPGGAFRNDRLECHEMNPNSCEVIPGVGKQTNAVWQKSGYPDCGGGKGDCNSACGAIFKANPGRINCTYGALDTFHKIRGHGQVYPKDEQGNRANALDKMCPMIRPHANEDPTFNDPNVEGSTFMCPFALDGETPGERTAQCSVYKSTGFAGDLCRAHLAKKNADQKDNVMTNICNQKSVCQRGQNDDKCLQECACQSRAQDDIYKRTHKVIIEKSRVGVPDCCWWSACKQSETLMWLPSNVVACPDCPEICQIINNIEGMDADKMVISNDNSCESSGGGDGGDSGGDSGGGDGGGDSGGGDSGGGDGGDSGGGESGGGDSGGGDGGGDDSGKVPGESDRELRAWFQQALDWVSANKVVLGIVVGALFLILLIWKFPSSPSSSNDGPAASET